MKILTLRTGMWVEEYLERERKSLRPARALPKYLMATNEEVCKEIQIQSHSGHESYWLDPIWWGKEDTSQTQFAVLFPPVLLFSNSIQTQNCIKVSLYIPILQELHILHSKPFPFSNNKKIKRKKLPIRTEKCEGEKTEQMDPEQPTATISSGTSQITALKLH